jgi:hypothetical protein
MGREDERRELEKALRKSQRALPINAGFAVIAAGLLWALHEHAGLPTWAALTLGFFAVFGAVGDVINIPFCKAKLRRLEAAPRATDRHA